MVIETNKNLMSDGFVMSDQRKNVVQRIVMRKRGKRWHEEKMLAWPDNLTHCRRRAAQSDPHSTLSSRDLK